MSIRVSNEVTFINSGGATRHKLEYRIYRPYTIITRGTALSDGPESDVVVVKLSISIGKFLKSRKTFKL